ncbi:hypothetical protein FRACA_440036 [Frankia canadensis]|uniref:Uncharacterized protein n=1 Tax=Frankia canadensis TaxID=1836972 RepID=A0A2I2KXF7_9ACTN|nr:hypothetical protein FRACA_440036 [Frankia canadensis]SOU57629.1 hypothetical protein FRACA_440036 [Frankia canadensis]
MKTRATPHPRAGYGRTHSDIAAYAYRRPFDTTSPGRVRSRRNTGCRIPCRRCRRWNSVR